MRVKRKKIIAFSLIVLVTLAIFGLTRFTFVGSYLWFLYNPNATKIYGTSTSTAQGPTDLSIGTRPSSTTLLIGDSTLLEEVLKPNISRGGHVLYYYATDESLGDNARVVETGAGDYRLTLKDNEEIICIINILTTTNSGITIEEYAVNLFSSCKIITPGIRTQIDINTMEFGLNTLRCIPSSNCQNAPLKFK